MLKYFNGLSIGVGVVVGMIAKMLGGWDLFLKALLLAIILDYITGLLKGLYTKKLSSEIGYRGFIKKVTILIMVAAAQVVNVVLAPQLAIREIVITFFLCNELLSLIENAAVMDMKIPAVLKDILIKQRGPEISAEETIVTNPIVETMKDGEPDE